MAHKPLSLSLNLPNGFLYQPEFLTENEQVDLLRIIQQLPFEAFDFHGYKARRRIVEYGWEYDFGRREAATTKADCRISFAAAGAGCRSSRDPGRGRGRGSGYRVSGRRAANAIQAI